MHDRRHRPMSPAEAASLRASSPVDEALLQRIRAALVSRDSDNDAEPQAEADADADTSADAEGDPAENADENADQHTDQDADEDLTASA